MNYYKTLNTGNGIKIYYCERIPQKAKAIVVISHGYRGHSGQYQALIDMFYQNGYGVFAIDHRGHGRSEERRGHLDSFYSFIEDTHELIKMIKSQYPLPLFMLGHSMGGLITFAYGLTYGQLVAGQILSAPALGIPIGVEYVPDYLFKFAKKHFSNLKVYPIIKRKVCGCNNYRNQLKQDPLVLTYSTVGFFFEFLYGGIKIVRKRLTDFTLPCLFLHGTKDRIIPIEATVETYREISSKDKTLKIYNGLYHELLQEPEKEQVFEDILHWLEVRVV